MIERALRSPALAVFWLALLVHLPSLAVGFVYDDHFIIEADQLLREPHPWNVFRYNLWDLSTQFHVESPYYRPWSRLMLWCTYQLAGVQPWPYHLANILMHSLNCALMTRLGVLWFGSTSLALAGGALFALHPRHIEVVAWPTVIGDLFCWFGAMAYLYLGHQGRWKLATLALLVSMLSKEAGMLVPGLMLMAPLLGLPQGDAPQWRSRLMGSGLSTLLAASVYFYLRWGVAQVPSSSSEGAMPFTERLLQGPYIFASLLKLAAWPLGFGFFRGPFPEAQPGHWPWALSLLVCAAFLGTLLWSFRRRPALAFCLCWWLYLVIPVLGVVAPIPSLVSDRHIYLAVAGWTWALALLVRQRGWLVVLGLVYGGMSWSQIWVWSDEVELWRQSKHTAPYNSAPRQSLGAALMQRRRFPEALVEYQELMRLGPDLPLGYLGAADALIQMAREEEAEQLLLQALRLKVQPQDSLWLKLGEVYASDRRWQQAVAALDAAVLAAPQNLEAQLALGNALVQLADFERARQCYRNILGAYPRSLSATQNLLLVDYHEALWLRGQGREAEARVLLEGLRNRPEVGPELRLRVEAELGATPP